MNKKVKQYEIVRELGSGASGVAYYAMDTRLKRPVVLKMLHAGSRTNRRNRSRILREARFTSALDHPNIAAVFEVSEHDDIPFIVMQYVPGKTLKELIQQGPLSFALALSIGIQIADGLAEAHRHKILHRDLKPSNMMVLESGLVKILDFGLAQSMRVALAPEATSDQKANNGSSSLSSKLVGTTAYMAPELFVTHTSTEQSDVFAVGVILYEMLAGQHPFSGWGQEPNQLVHAIQYSEPPALRQKRKETPEALEQTVLKTMAKQPSQRFRSASELRDALVTLTKSLHLETAPVAGLAPLPLPKKPATEKKGLLTAITKRFGPSKSPQKNTIVVLPFENLDKTESIRFYGFSLAEAVATRIARLPSLIVRPTRTLLSFDQLPQDPIEIGKKMLVQYVLTGKFQCIDASLEVQWQLLDIEKQQVQSGGSVSIPSRNLVALQNEISEDVFTALRVSGHVTTPTAFQVSLDAQTSDTYLEARGLLTHFVLRTSHKEILDQVLTKLEEVLKNQPGFAHAHSALGVAHLNYVRYGFGGLEHLNAAQDSLTRALAIDPDLVEANVYRVYTLLARGDKREARQSIKHLLETEGHHSDARIMVGVVLRLDGMFKECMHQFSVALELNPAIATLIYNHRARVYQYLGKLDQARQEVKKGLMLDPHHSQLRTTQAYLLFRDNRLNEAVEILESVLKDDLALRLAAPTLAMCYVRLGKPQQAEALVTQEILHAAEADGEMAYRLATYFAVAENVSQAIPWLHKAIYLGNENYPWFAANPAWQALQENREFALILSNLKKSYESNRREWKRLLSLV